MKAINVLVLALLLPLMACGGGGGGGSTLGEVPGAGDPNLSNIRVFVAGSPHGAVLKGCVTADTETESCTLADLPLIGQEHADPTVDDIMARVVVSHDWMGYRFRELLTSHLPADIHTLLKGVTAIVIDDDIRPSFYSTLSGAIYIDPAYLWMSIAEKISISQKEDFRSSFGATLKFWSLARYVKDNDYAFAYYELVGPETRTIDELVAPLAGLLYHELAHANDVFPAAEIAGLDPGLTLLDAAQALEPQSLSAALATASPLTSQMMYDLANVMYWGETATPAQQSFTAAMVGQEFASDTASDDYGYASLHEDVAMLFEETMMKYHFGIERDVAYTPVPSTTNVYCSDVTVSWGQRGRVGDPLVKARAQFVADALLGAGALDLFFAGLAPPTALVIGADWCANLDPATAGLPSPPPAVTARALGRSPLDRRIVADTLPPH